MKEYSEALEKIAKIGIGKVLDVDGSLMGCLVVIGDEAASQILSLKGDGWSIGVFKEDGELPEALTTYIPLLKPMLDELGYKQVLKEEGE